jgi:hypothetical protein
MDLHMLGLNQSEYVSNNRWFDFLYPAMKEFHYLRCKCVTVLEISLKVHFKFVLTIVSIFYTTIQITKRFRLYSSDMLHCAIALGIPTFCRNIMRPSSRSKCLIILRPWLFDSEEEGSVLLWNTCEYFQGFPVSQPVTCIFGNPKNLSNTAFGRTFWQLRRLGTHFGSCEWGTIMNRELGGAWQKTVVMYYDVILRH